MHRLRLYLPIGGTPGGQGFVGSGTDCGGVLGRHFEPHQPPGRLLRWGLQAGWAQAVGQGGAEGVARDVHRPPLRQCLRRRGGAGAAAAQPLAGGVQPQELLQHLLAAGDGLPQQQVGGLGQGVGQCGGQQGACTHAPQPQRAAGVCAQPGVGLLRITQPVSPGGVGKVARTVAAAQQVDLQHAVTRLRECTRLLRHYAACAVELFGKRVQVEHTPPVLRPLWRVE